MEPRLSKQLPELFHECKVCGERAAGFHFGAFTCEGCKSFFGRCSGGNRERTLAPCKSGGGCSVKGRSRTACKRCRWDKCLAVGMSRSNSRYGRRSHYFKVACLEETRQRKDCRQQKTKVPTPPIEASVPVHKPLAVVPPPLFPAFYYSLLPSLLTPEASPAFFSPRFRPASNRVSVIRSVKSEGQDEPLDLSLGRK